MSADLRDFAFMPLYISRLQKSKAWLQCKRHPELAFYMLNLWMRAWHELPAGSIEDDDDVLADAAMCSPEIWPQIKEAMLRNWEKREDGRLYNATVSELADEAWAEKKAYRDRTAAAREAKAQRRLQERQNSVTVSVTDAVTDVSDLCAQSVTTLKGQGQGQGQKKESSSLRSDGAAAPISENLGDTEPAGQKPKPKKARTGRTSIAEDVQPSERQRSDAEAVGLTPEMFRAQWRKFRDYHRSKGSLMADWEAAWRTWLGNIGTFGHANAAALSQPPSKGERTTNMGGGIDAATDRNLRIFLERYFVDGTWPYVTPKPGEPGCRVPPDLLPQELRERQTA